ncbi:AraC family transcriptional regulator [Flavobacterium artemisiae]|uniref:AraC family transcriptional regulator n=1 Tax=Flavobacterium artemisiae TaxID=2126556 RepID=A0ABW4HK26_9FLAO
MVKDHLWMPFELVLKEMLDVCPRGLHAHTFFELVYIVQGTGKQHINELELNYKPGDLFLVAPNDQHIFHIEKPTQFFFIRFNNIFVKSNEKELELFNRLEMILKNVGHEPGNIIKNKNDAKSIKSLMDILIQEQLNHDFYEKELSIQLVNSILIIIARNVYQVYPEQISETTDQKTIHILQYIQSNIYVPEKLRIECIGQEFGISSTYLGSYFKKHAAISLQQYILNYKLKLIEDRLLHSDMRISEIADAFGFTDKSHLNHIFKKYKGITPSEFRNDTN